MSKNNFKNFIDKERKLDRVIRFSAQKRIKDQSVSEHSFHTTIYAMVLADLEERFFSNKVNKEKVLKIALLHDLEECLTGDIIHTFKYIDRKFAGGIERLGRTFLENLLENLPKRLSKEYITFWDASRNKKTIEGKIVEAADKLEGLFYSLDEFSLGNKDFRKVIKIYLKLLKTINLKSANFILREMKINI